MIKIQDVNTALFMFEEAATSHAESTEIGDYKEANKNYNKIKDAVLFLKEGNEIDKLIGFLNHSSIGVRMAAATYLLFKYEREAKKALLEISKSSNIHGLTAEMILSEWRNGNLQL